MSSKIFISHSTKDKELAVGILGHLRDQGYPDDRLFLDSDDKSGLMAGRKWEEDLYDELLSCTCMIVLCTKNWQTSTWCFAEAFIVKNQCDCVVPLIVDDDVDFSIISKYQAIRGYEGSSHDLQRVVDVLHNLELDPPGSEGSTGRWNRNVEAGRDRSEVVRNLHQKVEAINRNGNQAVINVGGNAGDINVVQKKGIHLVGLIAVLVAIAVGVLVYGMSSDAIDHWRQKVENAKPAEAFFASVASLQPKEMDKEIKRLNSLKSRMAIQLRLSVDDVKLARDGGRVPLNAKGFSGTLVFDEMNLWPEPIDIQFGDVCVIGKIEDIFSQHDFTPVAPIDGIPLSSTPVKTLLMSSCVFRTNSECRDAP